MSVKTTIEAAVRNLNKTEATIHEALANLAGQTVGKEELTVQIAKTDFQVGLSFSDEGGIVGHAWPGNGTTPGAFVPWTVVLVEAEA